MRGGSTRGQYPTQEYLLTVFRYEPDTGLLWRIRPGKGIKLLVHLGSFSTVVEAKAAYTKYMRDRGVPDDIIGP